MTSHALHPSLRRLRKPVLTRRRRRRTPVAGKTALLSVAGIVGSKVSGPSSEPVGVVDDLLVRWERSELHPPLYGAVVRAGHRRAFVPAQSITDLRADRLEIAGALLPLPSRDASVVALAHDVLDRQVVDVDGADVVRVSDLVLARLQRGFCLIGADVSARTLLRRLGPAAMRRRVALGRVYDWASVAAFSVRGPGEAGSVLRLTDAATRLSHLGPADLDLLLDDLPAHERAQLETQIGSGPDR